MPTSALAPSSNDRVLSTLNRDGSRRWLRPRPMPGRFMSARRVVAYLLIGIFAAIPYIQLHGKPLVLLDLPARRFTILGTTFLPTDTLLLALLLIGIFVTIFLMTALLGRVWCGWACPQTVYLEFVFRPIERFFEGTPGRRRSGLSRLRLLAPLQGTPVAKALKLATYVVVAGFVAHIFLAYFVGVERLAQWVRQSPLEHPGPFLVMLATTGLMLFDFVFFREQTCIVACPYGRFQSVMLDRQSLIVSYDTARGEPRGPLRASPRTGIAPGTAPGATPGDVALRVVGADLGTSATKGDCVDCGMCTACCPTGIDIREGLQMECVGCAQCIDACDAVMDKVGKPRGLIRYSSQAAMAGERHRLLRPRVVVYPALLAAIVTIFVLVLARSGSFDVTVLRGLGRTFTELPDGLVGNPVRVKIVNRTDAPATFAISASGPADIRVEAGDSSVVLDPAEARTVPMIVAAPRGAFHDGRCRVSIDVSDAGGRRIARPFELLGPTRDDGDHEARGGVNGDGKDHARDETSHQGAHEAKED